MDRRQFLQLSLASAASFLPIHSFAAEPSLPAAATLQVIVSLDEQMLRVYRGIDEIASSPISSGRSGHATPTGIFSVLDKKTFHRSNIYSNAPMPFMQRLTWSGIALHASGHVPRYPASHGCVRMPEPFARDIFGMTSLHSHVVITRAGVRPRLLKLDILERQVTPGMLLSGRPDLRLSSIPVDVDPIELASVASATATDAVQTHLEPPLRLLVTRRSGRDRVRDAQGMLNTLGFEAGKTDGFAGRMTIRAIKAFQTEAGIPVTGTIGEKEHAILARAVGRPEGLTGHLYARRAFTPVFDLPVQAGPATAPLGTHLLVALGNGRFAATSLDPGPSLQATLDGIAIPESAFRYLPPAPSPGTSLVVSDGGVWTETGRGTDFIALT
jgi:peptidoglycan hydrolase-like protein with peptidoglycan-binding domain